MNIKTFTAKSMAEALKTVHENLGSRAVILHTRKTKRGGFMGIGAKPVVEVTAADGRDVGKKRRKEAKTSPRAQKLKEYQSQQRQDSEVPPAAAGDGAGMSEGIIAGSAPDASPTPAEGGGSGDALAGDLIRRTYAAAKAEMAGDQAKQQESGEAPTPHPPGVHIAPPPADQDHLAEEMKEVRQMVAKMMRQQKWSSPQSYAESSETGDHLFEHYRALIEQEVTEELAEEIVEGVRGEHGGPIEDTEICRQAIRTAIEQTLPIDESAGELKPTEDGRPRIVALVGPTGVGKTTTVAKLAATFKLKQSKNVAMITLDTYRIAAVEQLRTYAGIIGVPLHVVSTAAELSRAIQLCQGCDAVLIDTAGRSQRDDQRLSELSEMIAAANPHETHLVLSSTCSERVLMDTVSKFSGIQTDRVIFTKLDEAVCFGSVLNVARRVNKQLSYITTGQEVPHQIEPGRADRLASLVMGEAEVDDGVAG